MEAFKINTIAHEIIMNVTVAITLFQSRTSVVMRKETERAVKKIFNLYITAIHCVF